MNGDIEGHLLGVAVGDALGLAEEGLPPRAAPAEGLRYGVWRGVGIVSDDTEQTALVAAALCQLARGDDAVLAAFERGLLGWFARLPFGVGFGTLRACVRLAAGVRPSGVWSAGNGAAMRAGVIGVVVTDPARRRALGERIAQVTHRHPDAIAAALFVAEVAAGMPSPIEAVNAPELRQRLERAEALVGADPAEAARAIGTSGWVVESVPFAWWCWRTYGPTFDAVAAAVRAGGDTDSNAAIVGGWVGARARHALPPTFIQGLAPGPFGERHLRAIAAALVAQKTAPPYAWPVAMLRNLALYPVIVWRVLTRRIGR